MKIHLTRYFLCAEEDYSQDDKNIPVMDDHGNQLAVVNPSFFAAASLEGSAKLLNGTVINVTGNYIKAPELASTQLKAIADREYRGRYGYVGLSNDGTKYFTYTPTTNPWGTGVEGIALYPFVFVAADLHIYPVGTIFFCPLLENLQLPDGELHQGYLQVADTGSAMKGDPNHLDWFVGFHKYAKQLDVPDYVEMELYKPTSS